MTDKYQQTIETFNNVADQYWHKFKDFKPYEPTYDWFLQHLPEGPVEVLEIACGPGNVSRYLLHNKPNIKLLGIDLAPAMVKLAQKNNPEAIYDVLDGRAIDTIAQKFDAILCGFCLPYLSWQDSKAMITSIIQRLKPNGLMYLSTTEGNKDKEGYKGSNHAKGSIYIHYHEIEIIQQHIDAIGMEILGLKKIIHLHNNESTKDVFILARNSID